MTLALSLNRADVDSVNDSILSQSVEFESVVKVPSLIDGDRIGR